ncbi:MAG TPA: hypothetical protein PKM69_08490 [Bacteroidales bacterium]|nr:hypothetical protein [Bacteroidales bacterium]
MPRNVRNFWIYAKIDGRDTRLTGGPSAENGGMSVEIFFRENGQISNRNIVLDCVCGDGNENQIHIYCPSGSTYETLPDGSGVVRVKATR